MIIDRLVRRHGAESWTQIIQMPWNELAAEATSWSAATAALPQNAKPSPLPLPIDLVVVDVTEDERASTAKSAFDLLSSGGVLLVQEPEVPTGDVGVADSPSEMTPAQKKVRIIQSMDIVRQGCQRESFSRICGTGPAGL